MTELSNLAPIKVIDFIQVFYRILNVMDTGTRYPFAYKLPSTTLSGPILVVPNQSFPALSLADHISKLHPHWS